MAGKAHTWRDGPYEPKRKTVQTSWTSVGETSIHAFVGRVTDLGWTVCFSRTKMGDSLSLTVMAGNEKIKEYFRPGDDIMDTLDGIMKYLEA